MYIILTIRFLSKFTFLIVHFVKVCFPHHNLKKNNDPKKKKNKISRSKNKCHQILDKNVQFVSKKVTKDYVFTCSSELPEAKYSPFCEKVTHVAGP